MGKGGHLEAPRHGAGNQPGKWQWSGQNRTAAPHRSRWSSWDRGATVEEIRGGDGKWGALGEMRRAAVEGCHQDHFGQGRDALTIAQGPDGTKGFKVQRTRLDATETGLETKRDTLYVLFWGYLLSPLTLTLGAMLVLLFPSLVAGGGFFCALVWFAMLMRVEKFASIVAAVTIGLLVGCWILDRGIDVLLVITHTISEAQPDAIRLALILTLMPYAREAVEDVISAG